MALIAERFPAAQLVLPIERLVETVGAPTCECHVETYEAEHDGRNALVDDGKEGLRCVLVEICDSRFPSKHEGDRACEEAQQQ